MLRGLRRALVGVPVRSVDTTRLLDTVLICAVATILFVRTDLWLTNYPQLGGHGLHIAHLLWGGLLMVIAITVLLSFINPRARRTAAVPAGIGLGLFMDELGKFVTADNNYFFKPAPALIYCFFVIFYLVARQIDRSRRYSPREYLVNAVELVKFAAVDDLDENQRREALVLLDRADQSNPLVADVRQILERAATHPPVPPSLPVRVGQRFRRAFDDLAERPWFERVLIVLFAVWTVASIAQIITLLVFTEARLPAGEVFRLYTDVTNDPLGDGERDFLRWANLAASIVATAFAVAGLYRVIRGRLAGGLAMFERALLVSIFFVQVFAFVHSQFGAAFGFVIDLVLFFAVRAALDAALEREALERRAATTGTPGGVPAPGGASSAAPG